MVYVGEKYRTFEEEREKEDEGTNMNEHIIPFESKIIIPRPNLQDGLIKIFLYALIMFKKSHEHMLKMSLLIFLFCFFYVLNRRNNSVARQHRQDPLNSVKL